MRPSSFFMTTQQLARSVNRYLAAAGVVFVCVVTFFILT